MEYDIQGNKIVLRDSSFFDPEAILTSGQVFRFGKNNGNWFVFSGDEYAEIYINNDRNYEIITTNVNFFIKYFDFFTKYDNIITKLSDYEELVDCLEYGKGLRMLKQPLLEVIVGFVISANNNIPRIKKTINSICSHYGKKNKYGYSFPSLQQLSEITEEDFISFGCGYRANYLVKAIKLLATTDLLKDLEKMSTNEAYLSLQSIPGVGPKVADCILLFGMNRMDVFPVDTWIEKIYHDDYHGIEKNRKKISSYFVNRYKDLSGYAQQYLFYYKRRNIKLN